MTDEFIPDSGKRWRDQALAPRDRALLTNVASLTPAEQSFGEDNPQNDISLQREIDNARTPEIKQTLVDYQKKKNSIFIPDQVADSFIPDAKADSFVPDKEQKQQPYFPGDPTADVMNKAKEIGHGITDDPMGTLRGVGAGLTGMAGMLQELVNQTLPFTHMAGGDGIDPKSMMNKISAAGEKSTNAVVDPSNQAALGPGFKAGSDLLAAPWAMTGGFAADKAKEAGYPQVGAGIDLAGMYSMGLGLKKPGIKAPEEVRPPGEAAAVEPTTISRPPAKDKSYFDEYQTNAKEMEKEFNRKQPSFDFDPTQESLNLDKERQASDAQVIAETNDKLQANAQEVLAKEEASPPQSPNAGKFGQGGGVNFGATEAVIKAVEKVRGFFNFKEISEIEKKPEDFAAMSPDQYGKYTSQRELGYNSESSGKYARIEEAMKTGGLDKVPQLSFDKVGEDWWVVDHDGRHRADMLKKVTDQFPVRALDESSGKTFAGENPRLVRSQDGGMLPNPFWKQGQLKKPSPLAGVGAKQGGAMDWSVFMPGEGKKYGKTKAIMGRINMSGEEFVKQVTLVVGNNEIKNLDINHQIGITTSSFRATNPLISSFPKMVNGKLQGLGNLILKYWDDQLHLLKEQQSVLNHKILPVWKDFQSHYNLSGVKLFDSARFKKDVGIRVDMEKDNASWYNGNDWSPSSEQMVQHGMSPESARIWVGVDRAMDQTWRVLEAGALYAGVPVPPRIPGYIPHVFKGPYRVKVWLLDPKNPEAKPIAKEEWNYSSAATRNKVLAEIQKSHGKDPAYKIESIDPSNIGKSTNEILNGMWEAHDLLGKNQMFTKLFESIYDSAARGIVSAALDRGQTPKVGHLLERVNLEGDRGLTRSQLKEAANQLKQLTEDVNGWYVRAKFVNDVMHPLDMAEFLPPGNLRKHAKQYMEAFFHIPDKTGLLADIEHEYKDHLIKNGLDPSLGASIAKVINSGFAKYYLFYKPAYYIANSVQVGLALPYLLTVKAMGQAAKEPHGSILRAFSDTFFNRDPTAIKYAEEHGHVDPTFMESMDPGKFKDPLSIGIERMTRKNSFMMGYNYYRQFMTKQDALEAAGKFSDTVSVPYNADVGQPILIGRLPPVVRPFMMFFSYNSHMASLSSQGMRVAVESAKTGNVTATLNALSGAVGVQAFNMSMFGLGGLIGMQGLDDLTNQLQEFFGWNLPNTKDLGRKLADVVGAGKHMAGIIEQGILSHFFGYDISGSGQGATLQMPLATFDVIKNLGTTAILAFRHVVSDDVSKKEAWGLAKQLTAQVQGPLEYLIKEKGPLSEAMKTIIGKMKGEIQDYSIGRNAQGVQDPSDIGRARTQTEMIARFLFGLKSNEERQQETTVRLYGSEKKAAEFNVQKSLQILREGNDPKTDERVMRLLQEYYKDPTFVLNEMMQAQQEQNLTDLERRDLAGTKKDKTGEAAIWWEKYQKLQSKEPSRR